MLMLLRMGKALLAILRYLLIVITQTSVIPQITVFPVDLIGLLVTFVVRYVVNKLLTFETINALPVHMSSLLGIENFKQYF